MAHRRRGHRKRVLLSLVASLIATGCAQTTRDRYYQSRGMVHPASPGDPRVTLGPGRADESRSELAAAEEP